MVSDPTNTKNPSKPDEGESGDELDLDIDI